MTDWLEYVLKPVVSREEESEELLELPPEQAAYALRNAERQAALSAEEARSPVLERGGGIRLPQALIRGGISPADSVPAAIPHRQDKAEHMADIESRSESALATLYRRAAEAAGGLRLHGTFSGAAGQEKVIVVQETAAVPAGLTAEELDRAVRRDSRRYDGGMTIY